MRVTPNKAVIADGLTEIEITCETVLNISNQKLRRESHVHMWLESDDIYRRQDQRTHTFLIVEKNLTL